MTPVRFLYLSCFLIVFQIDAKAQSLTLANIGNPPVPGAVTATSGGFDLTASGADLIGTNDQFSFYYQPVSGDFDLRLRVDQFAGPDPFAKAGLMARETLAPNSRFAAALATPTVSATLFQYRAAISNAAVSTGSFPANYPNTWLRLQRATNQLTGYASYDGQIWARLGTVSIALSNDVYVGLAACSHNTNATVSSFREFGDAVGATAGNPMAAVEPLGPSSRRTGLVITEIMYKPAPRTDGRILDFVEIFNSNPYFEDISGYRLSGDIDYTFPSNTVMQGGSFLVVAKVPADIQAVYGISNVLGPYTNNLPTSGTLRLRNQAGHIYLEIPYENAPPWPVAADGTGHSLTLLRPSYGEGYAQAWGISDLAGGSPGKMDTVRGGPLRNVVINEFLANTDDPLVDYIELYNHGNEDVDLSGCILSDDPHTNKFVMPAGTTIPARGFLYFEQPQLGFGLNSGGEKIYFWNPDRSRVLDVIAFEAQANGVSSGRFPDGAASIYPLRDRTPGTANQAILIRDIVINEIMYKPISTSSDDEYVELYNKGTNAVDLSGWRFTAGISYTFPSNTFLARDSYLVVAKNVQNLLTKYAGTLNAASTYGDFNGTLANKGERLALAMPDVSYTTNSQNQVSTNRVYVVMDEVTYGTGGSWGNWANEGGSSLELIDPRSDHRLAFNWGDSDETSKAPWTTIQFTGLTDLGADVANYFEVLAFGEGEYLLDNAEVILNGNNFLTSANSTFETGIGGWLSRGTHIRSSLSETGGVGGGRCLYVRASARGDSIANRNLCPLTSAVSGTVTLRAQVRWLRGWPEILVRLHGNYIEATDRLLLPPNLGTPGARNSRARANSAPAIHQVSHSPVVPAANEPVVVTARVHDPDGISSLLLRYRLDPSLVYTNVSMVDDGTGGDAVAGDGLFSAAIPGQPANVLVAFYVEAKDASLLALQSMFPLGAPQSEALVRFGDPVVAGGFASYRQWLTQNAVNTWSNRPALSNERIPGTFVYGNVRAVYNIGVKYSGSPYHQNFPSPVTSPCHYSIDLPLDDLVLGTENFNKIHAPGNGPFDDNTAQREQACYWFARKMGLPWNYRRFVNMFVNGSRKGGTTTMMEDTETPGSDVVESRFPDDPDGNLYKLQPWFETGDGTGLSVGFANESWCTLVKFLSNGQHKKARYRWNYLVRAANGTANDYAPVYSLIDAANSPTANAAAYFNTMNGVANIEQWMRTFAVCHAVGDWDHFGTQNAQNMYGYIPRNGRWELMIWDYNIVLGNSGSWSEGQNLFVVTPADTTMPNLYNNPFSRRAYLRALKELATGPMAAANVNPVLQAKYNAMVASGVTPVSPTVSVQSWIATARTSILGQVGVEDATSFTVATNSITTNNNLITITGSAPVDAQTIRVNGNEYPVIWVTARNFILRIPVYAGSTMLALQGYDVRGNPIPNITNFVNVTYTGPIVSPVGAVTISEIMYHPRVDGASYVEFYNNSPSFAFDVSDWRVNGLGFTFPRGTIIPSQQAIVIVKDRGAFNTAYGTGGAVAAEFDGDLDTDGETLTLIQPGPTQAEDLVIDQVRYEAQPPWFDSPESSGIALQVIDPAQDNARVSNWSDGSGWKFFSYTGNLNISTNQLRLYLSSVGQIYVDDLALVAGSVPGVGDNFIRDGDFEGPFLTTDGGPWLFSQPSLSNTVISTSIKHSGSGSLRLVHQVTGPTSYLIQNGLVISNAGQYTISFWFLPITNNTTLTPYVNSGFRPNASVRLTQATPGAPNTSFATLPPYPPLWLNEVQPNNVSGIRDGSNTSEPWIELYNAGTNTLSLAGLFLADNYSSNLTQWPLPAEASIGPGEFKIIWADGDPEENTPTEIHTSFRLQPTSGTIALTRILGTEPQILDYLTYNNIGPNLSYGDYPDGQPFNRTLFYTVTPGATNVARPGAVFVNEWLASNQNGLIDPADNDHDDWFELFNPNDFAVDLGGYYLSDTLTNRTQYRIPNGYSVPAHGFLLVWADGETGQNNSNRIDLHANFNLARAGEAIGLFDGDGNLIDGVTFGNQTNDVSEGRFPDGSANRYFMSTMTPRTNNIVLGLDNTPPVLAAIADQLIDEGRRLTLRATASDSDLPAQTLTFSLDAGAPLGARISDDGQFRWTPAEAQGPGLYPIRVRVTDSGSPSRSDSKLFTVTVREVNSAPYFSNTKSKYVKAGDTLSFLTGFESDIPPNTMAFTLDSGAPAGVAVNPSSGLLTWIPTDAQAPGTYNITVRASDNGVPPLSSQHTYQVYVYERTQTVIEVDALREGPNVRLSWRAAAGANYEVDYKDGIGGTWQTHPAGVITVGGIATVIDSPGLAQRFYKVRQLP